jgi:RHS repeat-associated protein
MEWADNESTYKGYVFLYDDLSRLTLAYYAENGADYNYKYGVSYTYDKHSNVGTLVRRGNTGTNTFDVIDNLTMSYIGNQLTGVTEWASVPNIGQNQSNDFRTNTLSDGTGTRYSYDANGNRTKDLDQKITNITYNLLNLPRTLTVDGQTNQYVYAADGRKLTTIHGSGSTQVTTQYAGNMIYENNTLKRILVDGGYIEGTTYYYYLTDHLGNNRVVANASGTVQQVNHYYPYGMRYGTDVSTSGQPYKFGGKEFDGDKNLFWSDFHARQYYGTVPGFTTMDPLAEKYPSISPYVYCVGNPIKYVDPDGKKIVIGNLWDRVLNVFGYKTDYVKKVEADLNQLKQDHKDVRQMITDLEKSSNVHQIVMPEKGEWNRAIVNEDKARKNIPQGSVVKYDPGNRKTNRNDDRTPRVGLSHELKHSSDVDKGVSMEGTTENGVPLPEVRAIQVENKVRAKTGDLQRTTYDEKEIQEWLLP